MYTPTSAADGTLLYGTAIPTTEGKDSDSYLNTTTGIFYREAAGAWTQMYSVATSATLITLPILFGTDAPASGLGTISQSYINTSTSDFYVKETAGWALKFTIPAGQNGKTILSG